MSSNLLGSLEIGKRALNAQRLAVTVTGHNLANVNTPNFARQRAEIVIGVNKDLITGPDVTQIRQIRDRALDEWTRQRRQDFAESDAQSKRLNQLEAMFGDLPGSGITDTLSEFWGAWQDLTLSPESEAARLTSIERGKILAIELKRFYNEFRQMHSNLDSEIRNQVVQINQIAEAIAELNVEISSIEITGTNANDQRVRREQHLAELSEIINFRTLEADNGSIKVLIGGIALVEGVHVSKLETNKVSASLSGTSSSIANASVTEILGPGGSRISITSGEMAGLIDVRDERIPEIIERLDQLATKLMDEINDLHRTGYGLDGTTQIPFFSGSNITDISVNPLLQNQPEKLAVAKEPNAAGDNRIALAIAQKRHDKLFAAGTETFEDFNNSTISTVGVYSQLARRAVENNELLVEQLMAQKESISGVSIDEEMSRLIQFQRAYEAAARYVSTVDRLLETLINM